MEIFCWIIILVSISIILKLVYDANKKYKWFMKLKPGDKITVVVYSKYCECLRNVEVTKISDGKFIEAKIIEDCKSCSEIRSKDKDGKETCWYQVSKFSKNDVFKK